MTRLFGMPLRLNDARRYALEAEYGSNIWKATGVDEPAAALRASQKEGVFGYRFDWDDEPKRLWYDMSQLLGAALALAAGLRIGSSTALISFSAVFGPMPFMPSGS